MIDNSIFGYSRKSFSLLLTLSRFGKRELTYKNIEIYYLRNLS